MLPRSWGRLAIVCLSSLILTLISVRGARSQVFDLESDRVQMAELKGLWRFHTGDDPDGKLGWASPDFDDSAWSLLRSDKSWLDQGYQNYKGFAWYRAQVGLPRKHAALAIYVPVIHNAFQLFAGGRLVGEAGNMPSRGEIPISIAAKNLVFRIPDNAVADASPLVIAIRVWYSPGWQYHTEVPALGISSPIRIGDYNFMESWRITRT